VADTTLGPGPRAPKEMSLADALELAMGLHKNGLLDAAEELYRRILSAAPEQADALHFLGLLLHDRGDRAGAIALVQRAVALAPEYVDAINNLGNMLLDQERPEEAEAAYRRVLGLRPQHPGALTNVGMLLFRRKDAAGAEAAFRQAIAVDPDHAPAYHNLGLLLDESSRQEEALAVYQKALLLRPYDAVSHRRVGAMLGYLGRHEEAAAIYRRWLELEPDSAVARHMLASCSNDDVPARASDDCVRGTFETFAASFDEVLARLKYRAPALVGDAVERWVGAPAAALDVLDAGVGTGLCGPLLRPYARRLTGVDLSQPMLDRAAARGGYDLLEAGELTAYMQARSAAFDLVASADTFCYIGDLAPVAAAAAGATRAGGHLIFTVEHARSQPAQGFQINPHGRYSHTEPYLRRTLADAGWIPLSIAEAHLRTEGGKPVDGLVVVARRG
jgi:predicted TPR repeat methyltransferase